MGHDHKYLLRTNLSFLLILTGTVVTVSGQSLSPLFVSKDVSGKTSNVSFSEEFDFFDWVEVLS